MSDYKKVAGGVEVTVSEDTLRRVNLLLKRINDGAEKVFQSALKRAADAGRTEAKRSVTDNYTLGSGGFDSNVRADTHYSAGMGGTEVRIRYAGKVIPLIKFQHSISRKNGAVVHVRKDSGSEALVHAFQATVKAGDSGSHTGIFEREGRERHPIAQLYGPSVPQMMYSNENVIKQVSEKISETFEKRAEHEILRLLNGWGR